MHKNRNPPGFTQPTKEVCDENETKKQEKNHAGVKNVIDGGEHLIGCLQKTGGND